MMFRLAPRRGPMASSTSRSNLPRAPIYSTIGNKTQYQQISWARALATVKRPAVHTRPPTPISKASSAINQRNTVTSSHTARPFGDDPFVSAQDLASAQINFSSFRENMLALLRRHSKDSAIASSARRDLLQAYKSIISLYSAQRDVNKAADALIQMAKDGLKPDALIYQTILRIHRKTRDLNGAIQIIQRCIDQGIVTHAEVYIKLFELCAVYNMADFAQELLRDTLQSNLTLSEKVLCAALDVFINAKPAPILPAVTDILRHTQRLNLPLTADFYGRLLKAYTSSPDLFMEVLELCRQRDIRPTANVYEAWAIYLSKNNGTSKDMEGLLKHLQREQLKPSATFMATLMATYAREGYTTKMSQLLEYSVGQLKNLGPLQAVIHHYAKFKSPLGLVLVFLDLSRKGLVPTIRLNHPALSRLALMESSDANSQYAQLLLNHLQHHGDYMVDQLEQNIGVVPNFTDEDKKRAVSRLREFDSQVNLGFDVDRPAGTEPSSEVLKQLQQDSTQSILQQLDDLASLGKKLAPQIYQTIMELMLQRRDVEGGYQTLRKLRRHGQTPTASLYRSLFNLVDLDKTISQTERKRRKQAILSSMQRDGILPTKEALVSASLPSTWEDRLLATQNLYVEVVPLSSM